MNIAIFGASGATGRLLTAQSLEAGHAVTALVRTPQSFPFHQEVRIVEGSAFDPGAVAATVAGANVVFSTLGAHSPFRNENVLPRAVPLIVSAMQQASPPVRRIIALGSAGAREDSLKKQPALLRWLIKNVVYTAVLNWPVREQIAQYRILSSSDLDWTMVLPPMLTNAKARRTIRIDGEALPRLAQSISRQDVAAFMFRQIDNPEWVRKVVYITN